ncbi:Hypothetical predicted protein [Octopus vulgaris]|uniref:Uncharacterized protein n=1 Tax=Octopus vulgaris TaxID=6645 RepID=A0AA36EUP7_OCTVU|nr:Hypothetical predicted protein [Octopus vulgaris]
MLCAGANDLNNNIWITRFDTARHESKTKRNSNACGRIFRSEHNVEIHQGKSMCREKLQLSRVFGSIQVPCFMNIGTTYRSEKVKGHLVKSLGLSAQLDQCARVAEPESAEGFEKKSQPNLSPVTDLRRGQLERELGIILGSILKSDAIRTSIRKCKHPLYSKNTTVFSVRADKRSSP